MSSTPLTEHELNRHLPDFYPRIFRMVRTMVYGTGLDAEDITQDSFLKLYNKRHLYNGKSSLYTWAYQIAKNTVLDELRKHKLRRRIFWWDESDVDPEMFYAAEEGDETLDRRERRRLLYKALGDIAEQDRLMITMRDLEGLSYDEIAEVENVAVGTIKSRIFTARQRLRKKLTELGVGSGPQSEET
ncbi:sigma-70 family RNA polymerase sigma factor [Balneolales bacterium ANBcel1]|nr:sigma-70 family RNA polymerase sigma factor [Balneolales bacterium ANBcel1]